MAEAKTYTNLEKPRKQIARLEEQTLVDSCSLDEIFRVERVVLCIFRHQIDPNRMTVPQRNIAI